MHAQGYRQIFHEPTGYAEEVQMDMEEGGDQEKAEREKSKGGRMTLGSQAVMPLDERQKSTTRTELYDAEDHWHLGLDAEKWAIGEVGERVWLSTPYICKREGGAHHLETGKELGAGD